MKILTSFEEAGNAAREYVDAETTRFLEKHKELVTKVSEPVARAVFAAQIGSHMYADATNEMRAAIAGVEKDSAAALHELRQHAAHAAAAFAPAFSRAFGSIAMQHVVAPK